MLIVSGVRRRLLGRLLRRRRLLSLWYCESWLLGDVNPLAFWDDASSPDRNYVLLQVVSRAIFGRVNTKRSGSLVELFKRLH
jgi:hypothetical protein